MIPHGKSILDSKIKIIHAYFDSLCISDLVKMIWTTVCELAKFITTLYAHGQYHYSVWTSYDMHMGNITSNIGAQLYMSLIDK